MNESSLRPSDDVGQADWIRSRLVGFASGVHSVVPGGFPAYVRVFHPAYGNTPGELVRWGDVAARACTTMHALAQFAFLAVPDDDASPECLEWDGGDPETGNLEPDLLRALCEVLAENTRTPSSCWFCVWGGYGWENAVVTTSTPIAGASLVPGEAPSAPVKLPPPPLVAAPAPPRAHSRPPAPRPTRPLVRLPGREYRLFFGPLGSALEAAKLCGAFSAQSPNLFWPDDHAWCVGSEIDLYCTLIGGSEALAEAICAEPRLEAWRVEPDDPIAWNSDWINDGDGDPPPLATGRP